MASLLAARAGYRGEACNKSIGYDVPAGVKADPALRKRANQLVAFWPPERRCSVRLALVPVGSVILPEPLDNEIATDDFPGYGAQSHGV
ncbi:hypothetical protein [Streptomyces sp. AC550_RSS872]|uniref:hypothetical protein n=1 Tax=Streptomyces sp. AC550_RSS872 TaxID=2823689 RepID=UPI001C27E117|nr:hypothetical protein [Streptomyces sp. AC550_RSS872]